MSTHPLAKTLALLPRTAGDRFLSSVDADMGAEAAARWNTLTAPEPPTEAARYKAALERVLWLLERNRVGEAQVAAQSALGEL